MGVIQRQALKLAGEMHKKFQSYYCMHEAQPSAV